MATAQPTLAPGGWVQYNPATQSPLAPAPSPSENTIGLIRTAYTAQGKQYFQVVWNPGNMYPTSALYTADQLTPIDQSQAASITNEMNSGSYNPFGHVATGSQYQQPGVPNQALPPDIQTEVGPGVVTPTLKGSLTTPLNTGPGYYQ